MKTNKILTKKLRKKIKIKRISIELKQNNIWQLYNWKAKLKINKIFIKKSQEKKLKIKKIKT